MASLSELVSALAAVMVDVDEAEGVLDDDLEAALDAAEGELAEKVERTLSLAQSLDATAQAEKERAAKVAAHSKALSNRAKRIREWVKTNLENAGIKKLEAGSFVAKIAKSPATTVVDPLKFLPWALEHRSDLVRQRPQPDPEPDKKAILKALKGGDKIEGAALVDDNTRLSIS